MPLSWLMLYLRHPGTVELAEFWKLELRHPGTVELTDVLELGLGILVQLSWLTFWKVGRLYGEAV